MEAARETVAAISVAAYTLTPQQRSFADNIIAGMNPSEALRKSTYKTDGWSDKMVSVQAQKHLNHPSIRLAVEDGQRAVTQAIVAETAYTEAQALKEAAEARQLAISLGQSGAAVSAVRLCCDIAGLIVDRKHVVNEDKTLAELAKLTADERQSLREILTGDAGSDLGDSGSAGREGPIKPISSLH